MNASFQVKFLVIVASVSVVYAFYLDVRHGIENQRFVEWLRTERRADWDALTRSDRFFTVRAIQILRRGPLANDAEFHDRYELTKYGPRFIVAMSVAGLSIALVLLGTAFLDWAW
ncbi:MAG: hypothetical protein OEM94_11935 [Acidimicrobiia bacterium]|nr:hypothetical protein [Acidimicrobiia bacterium]